MNRRDFVRFGWATVIATGADLLRPAFTQALALRQGARPPQHPMAATSEPKAAERAADFTLQIAPMLVELAPQVVISTTGYNNTVPGPLLRVREGQSIAVEVVNDTDGSFRRTRTAPKKRVLLQFLRRAGGAMNLWPSRRVRAGTTRTLWPCWICIGALTLASSVFC